MAPKPNPANDDPNALLDPRATIAVLDLRSTKTLEAWRRNGSGPPYIRISPTCVRYRRGDLIEWINARRVVA